MMTFSHDTWTLVAIAIVIGLVLAMTISSSRELARRRQAAREQFTQWLATPQARAFGLWPGNCEIVGEREPSRREPSGSYSLTLYLRDSSGTHFLYISQERGPYVKAMTPEMAKVVLKERFRA
jgi:hypothetical protein